ncbi:hypothetical protein DL767_000334 [Monosporascus sp. MG133]|nr:hypothetical protein DL767_000334 [Monosporascus sp. MG133]
MADSHAIVMSGPDQGKGLSRITGCFNGRLLYACGFIALSQVNFGMDQGAFNGTQTMNAFIRKFGVLNERTGQYELETYYLSLLNSLTYIGFALGLVTGNYVPRRWGRKKCIELEGDRSWRIPLGLFFIIPTIIACGVWFMDESPRWLLIKGREEEARASLQALRQGKFSQAQIDAELEEQKASLAMDAEKGNLKEIFFGTNLKRTLSVIGVNAFFTIDRQEFLHRVHSAGYPFRTSLPPRSRRLGSEMRPTPSAPFFNIAIQFAVSFSIPYLLRDEYAGLGSKVGGKTLEEIDELFVERVPIRKFGKTRPRHMPQLAEDVKKGGESVQVEQA